MNNPTIAIIGSGALGGYYGARLAQHGHDVHFLLRSDYQAVHSNGWKIRSCDGDFVVPPESVHAHDRPETMPAADLIVITLKATSNDQFRSLITPILKPDSIILTLQNGLGNEELLASHFGEQRVIGGLAFTCINRTGPGEIHHSDHSLIRIGEFRGPPTNRLRVIAEMFRTSKVPCDVLESLRFGRWEKLIWNVPFNGLGAAMDLTTDRLIATSAGRDLITKLMREVIAIAAAEGIHFSDEIITRKIEQTRSMGTYYTSMQIDRRVGRAMEIDAIVRQPLQLARKMEVSTPLLNVLDGLLSVW